MDIPRQVARLSEICEVLVDFVGAEHVERRLKERRRDRESVRAATAENSWVEKVAGGDARKVTVLTEASYIFGVAPGNRPVCGPMKYIDEEDRKQLLGGVVGATYTIAGQPTIIRAAFEDTSKPEGEAAPAPKKHRRRKRR